MDDIKDIKKIDIKVKILQILITNVGGVCTPIFSFVLSAGLTGITIYIGNKIPGAKDLVSQLNASTIVSSGALILTGIVNMWLNSKMKEGIQKIQVKLIEHGHDNVISDGVVGAQTLKAIKEEIGDADHHDEGGDH